MWRGYKPSTCRQPLHSRITVRPRITARSHVPLPWARHAKQHLHARKGSDTLVRGGRGSEDTSTQERARSCTYTLGNVQAALHARRAQKPSSCPISARLSMR